MSSHSPRACARDLQFVPDQNIDLDQKLTARSVAKRFDVSVRTIDRWLVSGHMGFPRPVMTTKDISGRCANRFWRLGELIDWERLQAAPIPSDH